MTSVAGDPPAWFPGGSELAAGADALTTAGLLAAAVTKLTVDEPDTRSGAALYLDGKRQVVPYVSDCRTIFS